jgi:hypothetical protein
MLIDTFGLAYVRFRWNGKFHQLLKTAIPVKCSVVSSLAMIDLMPVGREIGSKSWMLALRLFRLFRLFRLCIVPIRLSDI